MLKSMIKFRTYHSLTGTMYSEFLYATGGIYKNNTLKTVERYDRRKNKWSELNSMIVKRSHHASSLLNQDLYVFFGLLKFHLAGFNSTVERLQTGRKKWKQVQIRDQNCFCGFFNIISFALKTDKIVILGGFQKQQMIKFSLQNNDLVFDEKIQEVEKTIVDMRTSVVESNGGKQLFFMDQKLLHVSQIQEMHSPLMIQIDKSENWRQIQTLQVECRELNLDDK